ncbi:MAG: hypothetical protein AABY22_18390 [Nanoarchaeota archaeon]
MDDGVKLISSAAKVFELYKKENMSPEEIMEQVSRMASVERDAKIKIGMIASASKALSILEKNPLYSEKQVLHEVMNELPKIMATAGEDVEFYSSE